MAVAGCRVDAPAPLPDDTRASGVVVSANPTSLVIRPTSSGRIRFQVSDQQQQPIASYPVDFAIVSDSGDSDTAGAMLSTAHGLTDDRGQTDVEVIVGTLALKDRPAAFSVMATCPGSPGEKSDILVTTNAYSVEILPVPADDLLGSISVATTRLYFYDNAACADLDLHDINASIDQARSLHVISANSSYVFSGVAASGVHAVIGLGVDSAGTVQIGGCVDVPGGALLDSETIRASLFMDQLFPTVSGTFAVASDFQLNPAPPALKTVRLAWQQWARCPLDPARLWIDCTIAALNPNPGATLCVPDTGEVGPLGEQLLAIRGTDVAPLAGTLPGPSDTPCHGATDGSGDRSLEASVDALFTETRDQLTAARLGEFPAELATLLDDIRIESQMTLSRANEANSYWAQHDILGLTFPDALAPISFEVRTLGLPVTSASGILSSFKAGQLSVPIHGFTFRLGTSARYAFEATSLKSRGVNDIAELPRAIFERAHSSDQPTALLGCDAFDAVACDQIKQARGCVVGACQAGLDALGRGLAAAFDQLDGAAIDFRLAGSAPVVDLDGDGLADALGMTSAAGGIIAGTGLWAAEIQARAGSYVTYGSWLATPAAGNH